MDKNILDLSIVVKAIEIRLKIHNYGIASFYLHLPHKNINTSYADRKFMHVKSVMVQILRHFVTHRVRGGEQDVPRHQTMVQNYGADFSLSLYKYEYFFISKRYLNCTLYCSR